MAAAQALDADPVRRAVPADDVPSNRSPAPVTLLVAGELEPRASRLVHDICAAHVADLVLCGDGAEALFQIGRLSPDAVLMSAGLRLVAAADVITVVRRHSAVPIAVGVGFGERDLAAAALAAGGTEMLGRPYRPQELTTMVNPWLASARARWDRESVSHVGTLEIDSRAYRATAGGRPLTLTVREFELLRLLVLNADRVVTRDQIRQDVWRATDDVVSANTIAVHIRRIRARLESAAQLTSVRGVGYRLTVAGHSSAAPR